MGSIPGAAIEFAGSYGEWAGAPMVAGAIVVAAALMVWLRTFGCAMGAQLPRGGWALGLGRHLGVRPESARVAVMPRLAQRAPRTRTPRLASSPVSVAFLLLRAPPGSHPPRQGGAGVRAG